MKLVRDYRGIGLFLIDDSENVVMDMCFIADEFSINFHTENTIFIKESEMPDFYNELNRLMDNQYMFSNPYSSKTKDKIVWFSDQYCNLEDEYETKFINRLIIKRRDGYFKMYVENPFCIENKMKKGLYCIGLSPAGNGAYSRNLETGSFFQDDVINMYMNLHDRKVLKK